MFDIGFSELIVIGLIALLVLGPKRLPEAARTAGRWVGRVRRFMTEVKQDFDVEMHKEELAELRQLKQDLEATRYVMEDATTTDSHEIAAQPASLTPTIHAPPLAIAAPRAPRSRRAKATPSKKSRSKKKHDTPEPNQDA